MKYTFAILEISDSAFKEIEGKLRESGYDHAFQAIDGYLTIDLHGIGVRRELDIPKTFDVGRDRVAPGDSCDPYAKTSGPSEK